MEMVNAKEVIGNFFSNGYDSFLGMIPQQYHSMVTLGFYVILIAVYSIFIWKFYKFLARKDIIKLDLEKYNTSTHPGLKKFLAILFFLLEYLIILPLLILFWFAVLSLFLLLLAKNQEISAILLISAAVIGAVRITAYISEDLSKDLAKMLPFTLLGIFLIDPSFFSVENFIIRLIEIPTILKDILGYIVFIFGLEFILRMIYTIAGAFRGSEEEIA